MRSNGLELWGGLECTVARLGDAYRDQVVETGHDRRIEDLDAVASLGIRTLRYPVVWEKIAPDHPHEMDWSWHDERLSRLRTLEIQPIAGLVHHGSGPRYTSLVDPDFPEKLAVHAGRVAERYPWIKLFTPVNEPLTTARFSGLYGHWYPHGRDYATFLRTLVIQARAVVLAMRAIRRVTPSAGLVQTEDLGKTFSTPMLRPQAAHENERRWLSFDLLCGRVDATHPWRRHLRKAGVTDRDLDLFLDGEGAPDIIGINHYLTSERYLDQRLRRYPPWFWGGNGRQRYADVEAVRVDLAAEELGPQARLREAWERYGRPLAVTEAHHGSTREEQVRWLLEVWTAAQGLQGAGVDIRAVTVWSLFGAVDWNSLLTRRDGFYEPGAFDTRSSPPRPTLLAGVSKALAGEGTFDHPVLDGPGWWRSHSRFYRPGKAANVAVARPERRLLIAGAVGALGRAIRQVCEARGLAASHAHRHTLDIADARAVRAALERVRPWAVVNAAGCRPGADEASLSRDEVAGAEAVARACAELGIPLLSFSTSHVFDGALARAYVESDASSPSDAFGGAKADAEARIVSSHPGALIVRSGPFLDPANEYEPFLAALRRLAAGDPVALNEDDRISPVLLPDLANAALDLLIDGESGPWHLAHAEALSPHELLARAARVAGLDPSRLSREAASARPAWLTSERGLVLSSLSNAIERWTRDGERHWRSAPPKLADAAE